MPTISATFVFFLGLLITALAINTTRLRLHYGRELDKHAKEAIRRASRSHGNSVEHGVVFALVLLFAELRGVDASWLWALAIIFLAARLIYVFGYYRRPVSLPMQIGAGVTYATEIVLLNLLGASLFL
ncbi:MAG TPA: hypothetical protein ENJ18_19320 [Nannocystis exedens]|nr:hypothetical protein [Nannocystis exedens]